MDILTTRVISGKRAILVDREYQTLCRVYREGQAIFDAQSHSRCPQFSIESREFAREESKNANPHQIRIDDVDASSFDQFLYFVYTGEPMTSVLASNEDLLKLAKRYQLETLKTLYRAALLY